MNISKSTYRFITKMFYGILEKQTVFLSDILKTLKDFLITYSLQQT